MLKTRNPASGAIYLYNYHGRIVWVTAAQHQTGQLLFWGALVTLSAGFVLKLLAGRTRL